jgi:hypothetical protein
MKIHRGTTGLKEGQGQQREKNENRQNGAQGHFEKTLQNMAWKLIDDFQRLISHPVFQK